MLLVKQVRMQDTAQDYYGLGNGYRWIVFHEGEFMRPLAMLTDYDMQMLVESYRLQMFERQPPAEDK